MGPLIFRGKLRTWLTPFLVNCSRSRISQNRLNLEGSAPLSSIRFSNQGNKLVCFLRGVATPSLHITFSKVPLVALPKKWRHVPCAVMFRRSYRFLSLTPTALRLLLKGRILQ